MQQQQNINYRAREVNLASSKGVAYRVPLRGNVPTQLPQGTLKLDDVETASYTFDLNNADGSTLPGAQ